jgi:uncharacterized protein YggT (Ycf19 family)
MLYDSPNVANVYAYSLVLLSDLIACLYTLLKIYRILCFSKITFDQLPLLNPYKWPISFFRVVTRPYFKFWQKLLPSLRLGKVSYDVSTILGLEALSSLIFLSLQLRAVTFSEAEKIISTIASL